MHSNDLQVSLDSSECSTRTARRSCSPRKGGPKEARMKAHGIPLELYPPPTYKVRFANLPKTVTRDDLRKDLSIFGEILSSVTPINMQTKERTGIGFVEFRFEEDANAAIEAMHRQRYRDRTITAVVAKQESIFSQDTGYITNENLDYHPDVDTYFDSSMPESHYEAKYRSRPIDTEKLVTVKVDNLGPSTSSEEIRALFSQFGEIATCRRPVKFATRSYHPFCFVRFIHVDSARRAIDAMDQQWLDGHQLFVSAVKQTQYYGQDESTEFTDPKKLAKKKNVTGFAH